MEASFALDENARKNAIAFVHTYYGEWLSRLAHELPTAIGEVFFNAKKHGANNQVLIEAYHDDGLVIAVHAKSHREHGSEIQEALERAFRIKSGEIPDDDLTASENGRGAKLIAGCTKKACVQNDAIVMWFS